MRHRFHVLQWIPFPVETVFAFFADPLNLPPLMPAWQRARIEAMDLLAPPQSSDHPSTLAAAGTGSRMTISFHPLPLPFFRLRWDAVIVDFEWNRTFCDVQRPRGPFRYWSHRHTVAAEIVGNVAGTRVTDELEYELPLGMLGDVANGLFVNRQLRGVFAYRQKRLLELLREG